jgi:myo-inositol-1(or 4)-monophosphatase
VRLDAAGLEALAERAAHAFRALRPVVLDAFAAPVVPPRFKADRSVVTDLDVRLEEMLAPALLAWDERWGLVSEEAGKVREGTPRWVLDPLDGTYNFSRRIPLFASQAALMDERGTVFSAVYEPLRDDYTWAARGLGTWRDGRRVRVSDVEPSAAVVSIDLDERGIFIDDATLMPRLRASVYKLRALGSIGLHLRDVAVGTSDGCLGGRGQPQPLHDVAPGALLVTEAGGRATDLDGRPVLETRIGLVAGAPRLHAHLLDVLRASS